MMKMPASARAMAPQVRDATASPRINRPRTAARKGEAASRKAALAIVVVWKARIVPPIAATSPIPPSTPASPALRIAGQGDPPDRHAWKASSTGTMAADRQARIVHAPATSI